VTPLMTHAEVVQRLLEHAADGTTLRWNCSSACPWFIALWRRWPKPLTRSRNDGFVRTLHDVCRRRVMTLAEGDGNARG